MVPILQLHDVVTGLHLGEHSKNIAVCCVWYSNAARESWYQYFSLHNIGPILQIELDGVSISVFIKQYQYLSSMN